MIQTVLGPIPADQLGFTLMHEHMVMADPNMQRAFPDWLDIDRLCDLSVTQLKQARAEGVVSMLDPTPISLGRDVNLIARLSRESGVQMLACTGLYYFDYPHVNLPDPQWLSRLFVRELLQGCQGTSIRASAVKCATEAPSLSATNQRVLEASALAANETGAPLLVHSNALNQNGLKQVKLLRRWGVDLNRVVICHVDEAVEPDYALQLLDMGVMIGFDRFGLIGRNDTDGRLRVLELLLRRGYADRIVLGHDSHLYEDFWRPWQTEQYLPQSETNNFHVLSIAVLPRLRADGVPEGQIDQMTVQNPARLLNWC